MVLNRPVAIKTDPSSYLSIYSHYHGNILTWYGRIPSLENMALFWNILSKTLRWIEILNIIRMICKIRFIDGYFIKNTWLEYAPFLIKDKIIPRIKELPIAWNIVKDRILKMSENIKQQQIQSDIKSCDLISICLHESTDITA